MTITTKMIAAGLALTCATAVFSQNSVVPAPENVVQLSASASADVPQDLLSITLTTTRDGADAAAVQAQLKKALDAALTDARQTALKGVMDVRTGAFSMDPRHSKDGKINGWQGTAELILEGRDIPRISAAAGRIQTLSIGSAGFGLSREERARVESEVQLQAIENFRARAAQVSKAFGFTSYVVREVAVNASDRGPILMRAASMEAKSFSSAAPVPVAAGTTAVTVNVSGSVQMK